ncbi:antibiotic biosynthesis monooxygenase [Mycobacterium sp. M1]|uniref:Antibiotic biosynthesis monooxygenase n=1 Tax=Mycolicibacter acidiphilus TaxID=2835306 RepID=A0ABS5RCF5_9MYCO|nr:putative quinol monooxygenase [Mycolicibacter acidiphilus]MBS9531970.1 antibiotic biosynthesis monooxygenase [Mycolicibacter acidiphilus]
MPVVVVATFTVKPDSVATVRGICTAAVPRVHDEPGCQLYSLHETDGAFVFIEQWADADALKTHSAAPAVTELLDSLKEHLAAPPDITMLRPVPAGGAAKGLLRG